MSKQTIGIGSAPNDGTGDPLRTTFDKTNDNFDEVYAALGDGSTLDAIFAAIKALASAGIIVRTGDGTVAVRSVAVGSGLSVANGDGVSGNPTVSLGTLLAAIAALTPTDGNIIVGDGSTWAAESGATARTSLGLGSIATQAATAVNIDGGNIDGTTIGAATPAAITGTTITATAGLSVSGGAFGAGSISQDTNWGMFYRSTGAEAIAAHAWANAAGTTLATLDSTGRLNVIGAVKAGATGTALKEVHGESSSASAVEYQFLARNRGPGGSDAAGIGFQVATSGEYDTVGPKAAIIYQRTAGNGRGALNFYNRATNDTAAFASGDLVASLPNDGTFDVPGVYNETTANAENVHVTSDGSLQRSTSSERYKTDLEPVDFTHAAAVLDMQPIWYRSTCEADNPDWSWYGLSAEAVAEIEPRLVNWGYADDAYEDVTEEYERQSVERVEETVERVEVRDGKAEVVTETRITERPLYDRLPLYRDGEAVTDERGEPVYYDVPRIETATRTVRRLRADAAMVPQGVAYSRVVVLLLAQYQRDRATYLEQIAALEARVAALEGA